MLKPIHHIVLIVLISGIGLTNCKEQSYVVDHSNTENKALHDSLNLQHDEAENMIAPYKTGLDSVMNEVLGHSAINMLKSKEVMAKGQAESRLGNFIADLTYEHTRRNISDFVDIPAERSIALLNKGGIRTSLPKGPITRRKIFELMPFENDVVILTLAGSAMEELFQYLATVDGQPVSNMTMGIKNGAPIDIKISGKPFDRDEYYKVITTDYLASGGDNMEFLKKSTNTVRFEKFRDVIIAYIQWLTEQDKQINAELDGRIYYDK